MISAVASAPVLSELIEQIENKLKLVVAGNLPKRPNYKFNIFDQMCESIRGDISTDTFLSLHFISSTCAKAVQDARKGNINSSKFWLEHLNYDNSEETDNTQLIKNTVLFPAMAFHKYAEGYHDDAISDLKIAINDMDQFGKTNRMPLMISACVEQKYNICKVLFKKKEDKIAYQELGNLLIYLHAEENSTLFSFGQWTSIAELDEKVRQAMIDLITNNSLINLFYKAMPEEIRLEYFKLLFQALLQREIPQNRYYSLYRNLVMAIERYYDSDYPAFLTIVNDNFDKINTLPDIFQALIMEKLNETLISLSFSNVDEFRSLTGVYLDKQNIKAVNMAYPRRSQSNSPLR